MSTPEALRAAVAFDGPPEASIRQVFTVVTRRARSGSSRFHVRRLEATPWPAVEQAYLRETAGPQAAADGAAGDWPRSRPRRLWAFLKATDGPAEIGK